MNIPISHKKIIKALADKGFTAEHIEYERLHGMIEMCGPDGGWRVTGIRPIMRGQDGFLLANTLTELLNEIKTLPVNNKL